MAFHVYHRYGECEPNPSLGSLDALYYELNIEDKEHPDVSLGHESGWSLSAFPSGLIVWENVEEGGDPRHMKAVPKHKVLELWRRLANGEIEVIDAEPWQHGYG